ncbi:MAG: alkaline phosphatase family protein [Polyangiaceae bacterium]
MKFRVWICGLAFAPAVLVGACGSDDTITAVNGVDGGSSDGGDGSIASEGGSSDGGDVCASCPSGYACATFNGKTACASAAGVPLFSNVFVVMMENLSYSTLNDAITSGDDGTGNFKTFTETYATSDAYHGARESGSAVHPSLPNYIALTSGDSQGVSCDCQPLPEAGDCSSFGACTTITGNCGCNQAVDNVADQIEKASKTWKAYGEGMGTPCNLADNDSTSYAVRHVPFLYYDSIRTNASRCTSHVVDFSTFAGDLAGTPSNFMYIAPNLTNDGHDPQNPVDHSTNISNANAFLGTLVPQIVGSVAFKNGGLLVVVWDEDDSSGVFSNDDPIPIFVMSPYAKTNFVSHTTADHYSLLATIEDGLNLPRLAQAKTASPLVDYFK